MRKTAIAVAMVGTLLMAAGPVLAADGASSLSRNESLALCTRLADQYDFLKPFKKGLPYWQKAKADFQAGKADCEGGQPVEGVQAMRSAIKDLYVKPETL